MEKVIKKKKLKRKFKKFTIKKEIYHISIKCKN